MNNFQNNGSSSPTLPDLLNEYRIISRSGTLQEKIKLLRQLTVADAGNKEWADHLRNCEEKFQNELAAAAKAAIMAENFEELGAVQNIFSTQPWLHKPNPLVTGKISAVLHKHKLDLHKKELQKKMLAVSRAYSDKDLYALQNAVAGYDQFLAAMPEAAPKADSADFQLLKEAKKYIAVQMKKNAEEAEYHHLVEALKYGLLHDEPLNKLEKYIIAIRSMDRAVPMELNQRFMECQEEEEAVARRKKFVRVTAGCIITLLLLAAIAFVGYTIFMQQQQKQWCRRLDEVISSGSAADGFELLDELEAQYPRMRKREDILTREKLIREKKAAEDIKREKFKSVATDFKAKMHQFAKYRNDFSDMLKSMKENIVDEEEESVYNDLNGKYETELLAYENQQRSTYRSLGESLRKEFDLFRIAVSEKNLDNIRKHMKKTVDLKERMQKMDDIPEDLKKEYAALLKKKIEYDKEELETLKQEEQRSFAENELKEKIRELTELAGLFNNAIQKEDAAGAKEYLQKITAVFDGIDTLSETASSVYIKHEDFLKSFNDFPEKLSRLEKKLEEQKLLQKKRDELLASLPQLKSFGEFFQMLEKCYINQKNIANIIPGINQLYENCQLADMIKEEKYLSIPVFFNDIRLLNDLKRRRITDGDKIIKQIRNVEEDNAFMIVAADDNGKMCTLYFNEPAAAAGKDPHTLRCEVLDMANRMIPVTIQYDPAKKSVAISGENGFKFNGKLLYPEQFSGSAPGFHTLYVKALKNIIDQDAESAIANAEKLLCNDIDTIAKDKRIHPYFKLLLIDEYLSLLVKTLKKNSSTYLKWKQEINTLREELGNKVKWQMTGSDIDIAALNRRIADCCNKYSNYLPYITIDRQIEALELIKKRKLTPAGFVFFNDDNTSWKFYRFAEAPAAGEFWIFRDNKFSIHGEYSGETVKVSTLKSNDRIMLVFTPADGKSTSKIQQSMENQGTALPESWPAFAF